MMKSLIKYFLIILFVSSCHQEHRMNNQFLEQISDFNNAIVKHFPSELKGMYKIAIFNDTQNDVSFIMLLNQYDKQTYNRLKDSLIKQSKVKYNPKDSCLLVVNMYSNEKNYFNSFKTKDKSYLKKECLKDKLPIPNFWAMGFDSKNITKLPDDYNIYVFEASHDIIDEKYLSKNVYMPDYWKHGYSRGIAMNDNTHEIIYWFVLW